MRDQPGRREWEALLAELKGEVIWIVGVREAGIRLVFSDGKLV